MHDVRWILFRIVLLVRLDQNELADHRFAFGFFGVNLSANDLALGQLETLGFAIDHRHFDAIGHL